MQNTTQNCHFFKRSIHQTYIYIHEASATIKSGKCQVYEKTDLRSDNDEAVGSDVSDELRVERVVEKIAMEENQQWEFSGLRWCGN